jgi:hypothetical protein
MDARADKVDAERSLRNELNEKRAVTDDAIAIFQEVSASIYATPAEFDIAASVPGDSRMAMLPSRPTTSARRRARHAASQKTL